MTPEERRRRHDDFKRSMRERWEQQRAEWDAGRVRLGGEGPFAGISDPILHESYLDAGRELLDKNRAHLRQFALPILFLQRHALELAVKHSIRVLIRYRQVACHCPAAEPKSLGHHHLKRLFRDFNRLVEPEERDGETLALMEALVQRFHRLDKPGTWARYRDDTTPAVLDLGESQRDLDKAFELLFAAPREGASQVGWITEYELLTHELSVQEYLSDGENAA